LPVAYLAAALSAPLSHSFEIINSHSRTSKRTGVALLRGSLGQHITNGFPALILSEGIPVQSLITDRAPLRLQEVFFRQAPEQVSAAERIATLTFVILPFLGLLAAVFFVWGWGFRWMEAGLLLGMYVLTAVGITVGFHRLFTHRSFETNWVVQLLLGILGSMAVQGSLLKWVALHRRHHQHSDQPADPHSPHHHGPGILGVLHGFWRAHLGWLFQPDPPSLSRYVKDLRRSVLLRRVSALFPVWVLMGLLLPTLVGALFLGSWQGGVVGFIWGGLVRLFLVHHVTWSVNSVCHLWGRQPFPGHDQSRNNFVLGILALGEGWHNNHHAYPNSARHGLLWWQLDVSYWIIRALAVLGLAWNVRLPCQRAWAAQ
jgi:stearoyl-CoA desaturase (Delta-9 desaturase)